MKLFENECYFEKKISQGFAANMFVGVTTNSIRCQLINLTCVMDHVHASKTKPIYLSLL